MRGRAKPLDVEYKTAGQLRTTPCLAWLVTTSAGGEYVYITGPDLKVQDVIDQCKQLLFDSDEVKFQVQNITVGSWVLGGQVGDAYFNDARSVDSEGMVQL